MDEAEMSQPDARPAAATAQQVEVDPRLLEILVCPVTHGALDYDRAKGELVSRSARLAFPIRAGVPIMLPVESRVLSEADLARRGAGLRRRPPVRHVPHLHRRCG